MMRQSGISGISYPNQILDPGLTKTAPKSYAHMIKDDDQPHIPVVDAPLYD